MGIILRLKKIKLSINSCIMSKKINTIGVNSKFYIGSKIAYPNNVYIGNDFIMHSNCVIAAKGKVFIGNNVTMSRGSQILTSELDTSCWVDGMYKKHQHICKDVHISDGTWLCVNSIILPGVSIKGKGVIVAAGAVVDKNVDEDYVIVAGVPAKIVKRLLNANNNN